MNHTDRWIFHGICFFQEGTGQWLSLEAELVMRDGEVVGTKNPTGHSLLVDCRFELPFGKKDDHNLEYNSFISQC
jgi:hypothetical protein